MSYLIYARKYRPRNFEEMIGQRAIVQTLQNAIKTNRVAQAYIFSGMRGVGKTTAARILAKALNCQHGPTPTPCNKCEFCVEINEDRSVDVLEIDGASSRKIEDIGPIRDTAKYRPIRSRYKVIIIDEVHMLSATSFNALLKTLEEPPEKIVFIFATTEFHSVPATIVSRCQHFEFKKISPKEMTNHLLDITKKEKITISHRGLSLIADAAEGSLRDAQSLLDQAVAFSGEVIRDEDLNEILGSISREVLFGCSSLIFEQNPSRVFPLVEAIIERGYDLRHFFKELVLHFRNLLMARSVQSLEDLLPLSAEELSQLKKEAEKAPVEDLLRYLLVLQQAEPGLRYSSHPQVYLEVLLVKLCHFQKIVPLKELLQEVKKLAPERGSESCADEDRAFSSGIQSPEEKAPEPPRPQPGGQERPPATIKAGEEKEVFRKLIAALQEEKSSLAAILSRQTVFQIRNEPLDIKFSSEKRFIIDQPLIVEIGFPAGEDFYRESVHREIKTVERIASEILGQRVKVKIGESNVMREDKRERETEVALKDPAVQAFMDSFKATILSVEPVNRSKGREER